MRGELMGETCKFRSRVNRREVVKIYVQYNRFEGTRALKTGNLR